MKFGLIFILSKWIRKNELRLNIKAKITVSQDIKNQTTYEDSMQYNCKII